MVRCRSTWVLVLGAGLFAVAFASSARVVAQSPSAPPAAAPETPPSAQAPSAPEADAPPSAPAPSAPEADAPPSAPAPSAPEADAPPSTDADVDADADADADVDVDADADADADDGWTDSSEIDIAAVDDDDGFVVDDTWDEGEDDEGPRVRYLFEGFRIEGGTHTRTRLFHEYVPFERGDVIDPESDDLEAIVWAIRGTGWFSHVRVRLERGHERGWVVVVIEVDDRNSVVVQQFQVGISEVLSGTRNPNTDVLPYVGFQIAETNLLGTGTAISLAGLMSQKQQATRLGFQAPRFLDSRFTLRLSASYHNGREFYGNSPLVSASCGPMSPPGCLEELDARNAVVFYQRTGMAAGFGRTVGSSLFWAVDWVGDVVNVSSMPEAASELRGDTYVPIDFAIEDGRSLVSSIRMSLVFDRRDDPNLTSRGMLVRLQGDVGSRLSGGAYDYSRLQTTVRGWIPLPRRQVLRLSLFAGVVTGEAPFFTLFHVSDLTDVIPSRVLELDIDRRPAPNFFRTSIELMRAEEFAARADVQWEIALQRGRRSQALRGVNAFVNLGLYALSDLRELGFPASGYDGLARLPIDATFDLGLRIDTDIGLFEVGFSNLLGFLDLRR